MTLDMANPPSPSPGGRRGLERNRKQGTKMDEEKLHSLACSFMYLCFHSFQHIAPGSVLRAGTQR